jgi:short subunit dehydrogenase-like uncharacterized protein
MGFNFAEEEITEMYNMYSACLDEIHEETKGICDKLVNYARELRYEPVIKVSHEAISFYNEELKQSELKAMEDWKSSELSFTQVMEQMRAGESAKNRSKQLENQIEQQIQAWKQIDDNLDGIDTTNWKCDTEDFENIKQDIDCYIESMETKQNQYENNIENQKSENEIYISIEPVVLQSISIIVEGFKTGINESFLDLSRRFEDRSNTVRGLGANAAQAATTKSQSFVSSGASALKAKVKQILD